MRIFNGVFPENLYTLKEFEVMSKYIQYSESHPNTLYLSDDAKVVLEEILREMKKLVLRIIYN